MSMATLAMVAESTGGVLLGADRSFDAVSTDTRSLQSGQLFFALRGERFDAASFVAEAERRGAAGAVVEHRQPCALAQVEVADVRRALADLARTWRQQFTIPVVAVTGSNGKTTVKEMIASILRAQAGNDDAVLATAGNLNNDIGLPLTLLGLRRTHRFAVIEMGANHIGEIASLAGIALPGVAIVTNAGPAHLEGFGSLQGVARGKGELFAALPPAGVAVINRDDPYFDYWSGLCAGRDLWSFGLDAKSDFRATNLHASAGNVPGQRFTIETPAGRCGIRLDMAGQHNVRNALGAAAAAMAAGADLIAVQQGLARAGNVAGRLRRVRTACGATLFDDSYNANPASVGAAIEFLASLPGESWLVFGDMGELGSDSDALHRQVGERARAAGIQRMFCVGDRSALAAEAFGPAAQHFATKEELATVLKREAGPAVTILVKASRFMGLEKVVDALAAAGGGH